MAHRANPVSVIDFDVMTPLWKKLGVLVLVTCALLLLLVIVSGRLVQSSPPPKRQQAPPWDSQAIQSIPVGIRVQEIDPSHAAVVFLYDLENRTDTDYRLTKGPNVVIMSRLKAGGTLSANEQVTLDADAFVPARNRTRIALEVNHSFNWPGQNSTWAQHALNQLVAGDVAGIAGFVLFDQTKRYQIDFPAGWPELQPAASTTR